ncbi:MAG: sulfurtransferase [Chloroflexi bacterium]|nr:sulfurtransferase [Chloroflexota bacterium]
MSGGGYAHPELLVETEWLAEHLKDLDIRIVDCEAPAAYARVHIPGAVSVPDNYEKDPEDRVHVMRPEQLKALMESLGIGDETTVVAYDARGGLFAARLWWVLNYYGHTKAKVLNGGWTKWFREGRPLASDVPRLPRTTFTPRANPDLLATVDYVKGRIGDSDTVLWDVRSQAEHTGENTRGNRRSGHMPGAVHLEWTNNVDRATDTFRPAEQLRAQLKEHGITPEREVVSY